MLLKANRIAKALVAFAVPFGVLVGDLAAQWLDITADSTIAGNEWLLLGMAIVSGVGVFLKSNAPPA